MVTTARPVTTTTLPPTTTTTTVPITVLSVAQAEVGGPASRYTTDDGWPEGFWCAKFASWVLTRAGHPTRQDGPGALQAILAPVDIPLPGDLVFVDLMPQMGTGQTMHVAIVEAVNQDGSVQTIEGNGPDRERVARGVRYPFEITGYGRA